MINIFVQKTILQDKSSCPKVVDSAVEQTSAIRSNFYSRTIHMEKERINGFGSFDVSLDLALPILRLQGISLSRVFYFGELKITWDFPTKRKT